MINRQGFTYTEIIFVAFISLFFGGVLMALSMTGQRFYLTSDATVLVQEQARQALINMTQELKQADPAMIAANCAGNACKFQVVLGFGVPPCGAGVACIGAKDAARANQSGWRLRYRLDNGQVLREILDDNDLLKAGTRVLANHVNQLLFSYDPTDRIVTVQVETARTASQLPGRTVSVTPTHTPLAARVRLRNP